MRHRSPCRSRAMHVERELYPIERALAEHLPHLRGPQRRGLALWVLGAVLAQSACEAAVLAALLPWAPYHALRQRLREWLLDGAEKKVPCARQVDGADPAPAAPVAAGRAGGLDRAGAGRPGPVEPAPLGPHPPARLAPAAAHPAADDGRARRSRAL